MCTNRVEIIRFGSTFEGYYFYIDLKMIKLILSKRVFNVRLRVFINSVNINTNKYRGRVQEPRTSIKSDGR